MSTTAPEVTDQVTHAPDDPEVFHYCSKQAILQSTFTGEPVIALCGATFVVTKAPKPGRKICRDCEDLIKMLPGTPGE